VRKQTPPSTKAKQRVWPKGVLASKQKQPSLKEGLVSKITEKSQKNKDLSQRNHKKNYFLTKKSQTRSKGKSLKNPEICWVRLPVFFR